MADSEHGDATVEFDWHLQCKLIGAEDIEMELDARLEVSVDFDRDDDGRTLAYPCHVIANGKTELPVELFEDDDGFLEEVHNQLREEAR